MSYPLSQESGTLHPGPLLPLCHTQGVACEQAGRCNSRGISVAACVGWHCQCSPLDRSGFQCPALSSFWGPCCPADSCLRKKDTSVARCGCLSLFQHCRIRVGIGLVVYTQVPWLRDLGGVL